MTRRSRKGELGRSSNPKHLANPIIAMQWCTFIWQGFMDACGHGPIKPSEQQNIMYARHTDDVGMGQDGAVAELSLIVNRLVLHYDKHWKTKLEALDSYPGVFEYEILEPLGEWLAESQTAFSNLHQDKIDRHLDELIASWFVTDQLLTGT